MMELRITHLEQIKLQIVIRSTFFFIRMLHTSEYCCLFTEENPTDEDDVIMFVVVY